MQGHAGTPRSSQDHDGGGEEGAAGGEHKPRKKAQARIKCITKAGTPRGSQEHDGSGEQGAAGGEHKPRKKARIKWITFARGTGFKTARGHLEDLVRRECDGVQLGPRGDTTSTLREIQYTYQCSYRKKPWCCEWRCKICIQRKTSAVCLRIC